jgi:hypothetical protein
MRLNIVHGFGRIYWIVRDTATGHTPRMCIGWTKELGGHWRTGKGPQIKFGKFIFQFGFCKKHKVEDEMDGILMAVEGRILDTTTAEISIWR